MTAQSITLNPVNPGAASYIQAAQGENNARILNFTVIGADNQPIELAGCTVVFYVDRDASVRGLRCSGRMGLLGTGHKAGCFRPAGG